MNRIKSHIGELIAREIRECSIDNWHGIDKNNVERYLVSPYLQTYLDPMNKNIKFELWTVLEELPEAKSGYTIVYDSEKNEFGLGVHGADGMLTFLGYYGGFVETLNGM